MKPREFKHLVDKFYAGETSEQEETALRTMLELDDYDEKFADLKSHILAMMELQKETGLDESFDQFILQEISTKRQPFANRRIWGYRLSGVAAAVLMFLAIWFGSELFQPKAVYGTITDPKIAFLETQKVLDTIVKKMNKGTAPMKKSVKKLDKNLSEVSRIKEINKTMKKIKKLEDLDHASELLKSFNKVSVNYGSS